jgi:hypothetical protein
VSGLPTIRRVRLVNATPLGEINRRYGLALASFQNRINRSDSEPRSAGQRWASAFKSVR